MYLAILYSIFISPARKKLSYIISLSNQNKTLLFYHLFIKAYIDITCIWWKEKESTIEKCRFVIL